MNTTTKREFHWFWAWQDEQEEEWLRSMSNRGWHMQQVTLPGWYTFSPGAPTDFVYRLDYITTNEKNADYFLLFQDAGWDYLGEMSGWQYFRKEAAGGSAPEIFSDQDSKARKYRRVLAFLLILLPVLLMNLIILSSREVNNGFLDAVRVLYVFFLILYGYAFLKLAQRIRELQRL